MAKNWTFGKTLDSRRQFIRKMANFDKEDKIFVYCSIKDVKTERTQPKCKCISVLYVYYSHLEF